MSELDRSNIDAMHWAEQFCLHKAVNKWSLEDIDEGLMLGWFANYRFAVADPLTAKLEALDYVGEKADEKIAALQAKLSEQSLLLQAESAELAKAEGEASSLAMHLKNRHYNHPPTLELCDSVAGIISQIDNMTAGILNDYDAMRRVAREVVHRGQTYDGLSKNYVTIKREYFDALSQALDAANKEGE